METLSVGENGIHHGLKLHMERDQAALVNKGNRWKPPAPTTVCQSIQIGIPEKMTTICGSTHNLPLKISAQFVCRGHCPANGLLLSTLSLHANAQCWLMLLFHHTQLHFRLHLKGIAIFLKHWTHCWLSQSKGLLASFSVSCSAGYLASIRIVNRYVVAAQR